MAYEELKKKFPAEGNRCLKSCGKCCVSGAPLTAPEAEAIGEWICENKELEDVKAQFLHFDDNPKMCPFLTPEKTCFIYPARPVVCVMFGHLKDTPELPKKWSQECPEGIKFTFVEAKDTLPESLVWQSDSNETMLRTMSFRSMAMVSGTGEELSIPPKPGSKFERITKATHCFRCNYTFPKGARAYLEGDEILCQKCEDSYDEGPGVRGSGKANGI